MPRYQLWYVCVTCIVCSSVGLAEVAPQQTKPIAASKRQMDGMRRRVDGLKIVGHGDTKIEISDQPLLRYNDATRGVVDASLWALGKEGRPHAIFVLEVYDFLQYEFTAITDPPKTVTTDGLQWAPPRSNLPWLPIKNAKPPHELKRIRLRQIKQLAREFSASEEWRGKTYQLRLMPQPIHQYEDEESGVVDGAIFVLAHGTNVEILMSLEAKLEKDGTRSWQALFSRLASASLTVSHRKELFWKSGTNTQVGASGAYFFKSMPLAAEDRSVFSKE